MESKSRSLDQDSFDGDNISEYISSSVNLDGIHNGISASSSYIGSTTTTSCLSCYGPWEFVECQEDAVNGLVILIHKRRSNVTLTSYPGKSLPDQCRQRTYSVKDGKMWCDDVYGTVHPAYKVQESYEFPEVEGQ